MRITFVTPYFAPAWSYGGPPRVLYLFAVELIRLGHTVTVITTDALNQNRNLYSFERLENISVYRFHTISNYLAFKQKIFYVPDLLHKTKEIISKSDIVLFSDLRTILNWQIYSFLNSKKIPYGLFPFGQIPYDNGFKSIIKRLFDLLWVRDFVNKATWRFAQTPHEQEMYGEFFDIPVAHTHLLHLPISTKKRMPSDKEITEFRKKLKIQKSDKLLLFVGRLHYLKGADILIHSVIPLLKKDKRLKLLIVGRDDGHENFLKSLVPKGLQAQIIFTGPLYGSEVEKVYYLASCFIITPRFYEETSTAALEALSYGVPVVTTHEASIPFLERYKAGKIVKNDVNQIRWAISYCLNEIKFHNEQIKIETKKLIQDHFTQKNVSKKLISFLFSK